MSKDRSVEAITGDEFANTMERSVLHEHAAGGPRLQSVLFGFIGLLVLLLLFGSFILNITVTRDYLEKQLHSHAQDAATSLGLSLSTSIDARDAVKAERIVDAMFDSGDYSKIVLFDTKGEALVIRDKRAEVIDVPEWFVSLIDLSVASQTAQVVAGWTQLGTVVVESHTGYAYAELWRMIRSQAVWFILIAVVGLLIAQRMLRGILKPLEELELQAQEMSARRFEYRVDPPKARELAYVAMAMNDMAGQLGDVFEGQLDLIEGLRKQSFIDKLTGLSNREGFDGRLKTELDSQQHTPQGTLILIQLHDFGLVNEAQGRQAGDSVLIALANKLFDLLERYQGGFAARRSGADFSVFLPRLMADDIDTLAQTLLSDLCSLTEIRHLLRDDSVHIGLARVRNEDTARSLFSKADLALRKAQSSGISAWQRYANIETAEESIVEVRQANEWRAILQDVLAQRALMFHTQTVYDKERSMSYQQVLSRIEVDGELVVAGVFLPMAERFGLMVPFDRLVVEKVIAKLSSNDSDASLSLIDVSDGQNCRTRNVYCVSLSESSISDDGFMEWFEQQMDDYPEIAQNLMIEVAEHVVSYNEQALVDLSVMAQRYGFGVSIERFGVSSVPFSYLQRVQIDTIKIDHSFIRDIQGNQSNQFFLRSAVQIAHGQNIRVVAVGVESEEEWEMLKSLGVDGAMGYYLERPKANKVFSE